LTKYTLEEIFYIQCHNMPSAKMGIKSKDEKRKGNKKKRNFLPTMDITLNIFSNNSHSFKATPRFVL